MDNEFAGQEMIPIPIDLYLEGFSPQLFLNYQIDLQLELPKKFKRMNKSIKESFLFFMKISSHYPYTTGGKLNTKEIITFLSTL
jgi:hypothetical protein